MEAMIYYECLASIMQASIQFTYGLNVSYTQSLSYVLNRATWHDYFVSNYR